jgi:hypothetical protein
MQWRFAQPAPHVPRYSADDAYQISDVCAVLASTSALPWAVPEGREADLEVRELDELIWRNHSK